ncbi:MAG: MBL fold metallo-hydrolase [Cryobacterium sp.]|nr:MBL fold metallo-hydrolase [Cryobacterium sp.]
MDTVTSLGSGIAVLTPAAGSNVSAIAHEATLLFVDAGTVPSASRLFRSSVAPDGAHSTIALLTHHHADHVFGAAGLKADRVLATDATDALLGARGDSEREHLTRAMPGAAEELAATAVPRATETISAPLDLDLGGRTISLIPVGHAHTPGDLVAFDRSTKTLFTGDVAFNGLVPVLRDADSLGWIRALHELLRLEPDRVVPGHGPVGGADILNQMIDLLETLRAVVTGRVQDAEPSLEPADLPERFRGLARAERLTPAARHIANELTAPHTDDTPTKGDTNG